MANNDEALENLRWKKFPVLNDGFVCLVDAMGSDDAIVQGARKLWRGHKISLRR